MPWPHTCTYTHTRTHTHTGCSTAMAGASPGLWQLLLAQVSACEESTPSLCEFRCMQVYACVCMHASACEGSTPSLCEFIRMQVYDVYVCMHMPAKS